MSLHGRLGWGWVKIYWCSMLRLFLFWVNNTLQEIEWGRQSLLRSLPSLPQANLIWVWQCVHLSCQGKLQRLLEIHIFVPAARYPKLKLMDSFQGSIDRQLSSKQARKFLKGLKSFWQEQIQLWWKWRQIVNKHQTGRGKAQGNCIHFYCIHNCIHLLYTIFSFIPHWLYHSSNGNFRKKQTMRKENCLSGLLKLKCW